MQKENVKVVVKLACFPARFLAARRVGVSRFFVSDRWDNLRKKIGRCRITDFRHDRPFYINNQRAFTLIELLVVVLIIGILAAVAVPQYQVAVLKSRIAATLPFVRAVKDAQERYYLANAAYTAELSELDVSVKCPNQFVCTITSSCVEVRPRNDYFISIIARYDMADIENEKLRGKIYCWASSASAGAKNRKICQSYGPLLFEGGSPAGVSYLIQ